jgi:hypothetical protein
MQHTGKHASWRISRSTTIERGRQPDIVPTGEVCATISPRFTSSTSRKHAYFGPSRTMRARVMFSAGWSARVGICATCVVLWAAGMAAQGPTPLDAKSVPRTADD